MTSLELCTKTYFPIIRLSENAEKASVYDILSMLLQSSISDIYSKFSILSRYHTFTREMIPKNGYDIWVSDIDNIIAMIFNPNLKRISLGWRRAVAFHVCTLLNSRLSLIDKHYANFIKMERSTPKDKLASRLQDVKTIKCSLQQLESSTLSTLDIKMERRLLDKEWELLNLTKQHVNLEKKLLNVQKENRGMKRKLEDMNEKVDAYECIKKFALDVEKNKS